MELVSIVTGRLGVTLDGSPVALGVGDALTFPGPEPHTWRNAYGTRPCDVLSVMAPAP